MKKLLSAIIASTVLSTAAFSGGHSISEFRIGILGGENAQDRMTNNECFRQKAEDLLGVPSKIFAPADYDGVIQGLLGGTIDNSTNQRKEDLLIDSLIHRVKKNNIDEIILATSATV